jgi:FkbM family methyltransferase
MRFRERVAVAIREWLHPDRAERSLARKALSVRCVERASFGECLNDDERLDLLTSLLRQMPEPHRGELLAQVGFSRSQLMQDLFVLSETGVRRDAGFFVEFGAADGVALSNSWLLEQRLGWKGILAEPARCWHDSLSRNRACAIETDCVWSRTGEKLDFDEVAVGEFSTLSEFSQSDGHAPARAEKVRYQVPTISLNDLLRRHGAPAEPDYLSIDTEGSEFAILRELDFARFAFKVITCEHNHTPMREQIRQLLESAGYRRKHEELSRFDDWYVRAR